MAEIQDAAKIIKNINSLKINHGLIINAKGVCPSKFSAYSPCSRPKATPLVSSFEATLKFSTKRRDSFLFKNHIDHYALDLKHCDWIFANSAETLLINESPINDVCLKVQCSQFELIVEKETIKPSEEIVAKIKEALEHYNPYNELMNIFEIYGKFIPKKLILGHKLYRVTCLIVDESLPDANFKEGERTADFMTEEYNDILNQWEKCIGSRGFDSSYFVTVDDKLIMKDELEKWMKICSESDYDSLQIISLDELCPIYEIFDESLCDEIKSILGINCQPESFNIKEKVLFSGIIPVNAPPFSYRANFPVCFKSNNYQVFGKLVKQSGEPIDKVTIKFKFIDIYGFYAFVENFDAIAEHTELQIEWILIGIPAKIGFFSINTRNIRILRSINTSFSPRLNENNWNITLNIQESLPQYSFLVTSFKYSSNYERSFDVDALNYRCNDNKIELNVYIADNKDMKSSPMEICDSDGNNFKNKEVNGDEPKCLIQCFILFLESREKLAVHLNAIGKTVSLEEEMTSKLQNIEINSVESKHDNYEEKGPENYINISQPNFG
ncbi:9363_t:CDS:2, partial [Cetraspora pellucida]